MRGFPGYNQTRNTHQRRRSNLHAIAWSDSISPAASHNDQPTTCRRAVCSALYLTIMTHGNFLGNARNTFQLPPSLLSHHSSPAHAKPPLGLHNLQPSNTYSVNLHPSSLSIRRTILPSSGRRANRSGRSEFGRNQTRTARVV